METSDEENLKILRIPPNYILDPWHKLLEASRGRDKLDTGKALTRPIGDMLHIPRYTCSRLQSFLASTEASAWHNSEENGIESSVMFHVSSVAEFSQLRIKK